jgi:beta-glucosidase
MPSEMKSTVLKSVLSIPLIFCITVYTAHPQRTRSQGSANPYSKKIEILLKQLTLEEKIGQLSLFVAERDETGSGLTGHFRDMVRKGNVGAVLNTHTVDNVLEIQRIAVEESRMKIPLLFGLDVIHGYRTIFPIPLGQAATWNPEAIRQAERIAATEATAEGINWTFAPMVDIARDPRWGRVAEGAGEDTWLACKIAEARVRGFQGDDLAADNTLLACAKHFAAYGAAMAGRDYNTVDMSELSLYEWYLPPYKACVDAGAGSVMTSFNEINGRPSTSNPWLLTDILRKQWGFTGFIVTDWTSLNELVPHGVAADVNDAVRLALNAGVDMDMQGGAYLENLGILLKEGRISIRQIDDAVRYVLEAKFRLGLFDDPYRYCNREREQKEIMTREHLAFARKMAAESCVLLKNDHSTLPVPGNIRTLAVIGPLGDARDDMLGCWAAEGDPGKCVTLLEGIRVRTGDRIEVFYARGCNTNDTDTTGFNEASLLAEKSDFVILALGENEWMSGEASSRAGIDLPGVQNELAERIIRTGRPVAVVLFSGRPLAITKLDSLAPAILEAWFGGTEAGNGIADVLFGDYNPSGRLTMTFPRNLGQVPVYYNSKNTGRPYDPARPDEKYVSRYLDSPNDPLYPFGFGLSFTTFSYAGLDVKVNGTIVSVTVSVTNTGSRDGEEVVQLYIRDKVGSITRPVKELKGFQKVMIRAGETRTLVFSLTADDLAFYHPDLTKYWEPGEFIAYVGGSSAATLSASFWLK